LPLLTSQTSYSIEKCREIVEHKETTIRHKKTIIEDEGFISYFHLSHDAGRQKLATVYVEYRIYYFSQGAEVYMDGNFHTLVKGKGHDLTVRLSHSPGFVPEKILGVDIRKSYCSE
jgi:hypothetical protein